MRQFVVYVVLHPSLRVVMAIAKIAYLSRKGRYMHIIVLNMYFFLMSYLLLQFLWPDGRAQSTDVNIEEWWSTIDRKMVEAAAFSSAKQESIQANQIAPWIAPACRGVTVVNSEVLKGEWQSKYLNPKLFFILGGCSMIGGPIKGRRTGCPKKLASLIREGSCDPESAVRSTAVQLRELCRAAGMTVTANATKVKF